MTGQRAHMSGKAKPTLAAALLVAAFGATFAAFPARAQENCVTAPTGATPPGSHWYYRTDPATHVKCWHLKEPDQAGQNASAAQQPAAGAAAGQPQGLTPNQAAGERSPQSRPLQSVQAAPNVHQTPRRARTPVGTPVTDAVPWLDTPLPAVMAGPAVQSQVPAHPNKIVQPASPSPAAAAPAVGPSSAAASASADAPGSAGVTTPEVSTIPVVGSPQIPAAAPSPTGTPSATLAAPMTGLQSAGASEPAQPSVSTSSSAASASLPPVSSADAGNPLQIESSGYAGGASKPQPEQASPAAQARTSQSQSAAVSSTAPAPKMLADRFFQVVNHNRMAGGLVLANLLGLLIAGAFVSRILRRITTLSAAARL